MSEAEGSHFDRVKEGVGRLVGRVSLVRMEIPDGGREWCFSPDSADEKAILELLELWDRWENNGRGILFASFPERRQEITEILRILRSKIGLNKTNRYFMGYSREGDNGESGRDFFLTTFNRTLDHLAGLWRSAEKVKISGSDDSLSSEGS